MSLIPDSLVAEARAIQASAMPQAATLTPGGAVNCRVIDLRETARRTAGMPMWFMMRYAAVELPYGTAVAAGYTIAVTGGTTFVVLSVDPPGTYRAKEVAKCVDPSTAFFNERVTVTKAKDNSTVGTDIPVVLWPAGLDVQTRSVAAAYDWAIGFPTSYEGQIALGDQLAASWLKSTVDLTRPRRNADPSNPLLVSYFHEPA